MYHVPFLFNVYIDSDEGGENGDGKKGNEISGGRKRVEIALSLICL